MSISVVHLSTARSWRGGERQLLLLARESMNSQFKPLVLCPLHSALEKECHKQGIPVDTYRSGWRHAWGIIPLLRLIHKASTAILHTHDAKAHTLAYWTLWIMKRWPLFKEKAQNKLPGLVVHRRVDFPVKNSWLSRAKYLSSHVRAVICVSGYVKKVLLQSLGPGGSRLESRVFVVHSGVDNHSKPAGSSAHAPGTTGHHRLPENPEPQLSPEQQALKHQQLLWKRAGHPIIGTLAALAPHKDLFTFLRTARICMDQARSLNQPEPRFVVLGEGALRTALERERQDLGLTEALIMPGFVPFHPRLLKDWDLFLFTSKEEGLGTSLIDALLAGLPIVATHTGGIPELMDDPANGRLCPVGDAVALAYAVRELLAQPGTLEKISAANVEKARLFLAPAMAAGIHKVYKTLVSA